MISRLAKKYENLCPYGEKRLNQLVEEDERRIIVVGSVALLAFFWWNMLLGIPSALYFSGGLVFTLYIVYTEISGSRIQKTEYRIYKEMLSFLSRVKHFYMSEQNVANAIKDAAEETGEELRLHASRLYRILSESDRREQVRNYILYTKYNQYLKLFLVQAFETSEKGDIKISEDSSLFSENLEHLRLIVMEEIYRRKKRSHEFSGYTFVSLAPFYAMPILRQWGLEFEPDLAAFYGGIGKIIEVITLLVSYAVYSFINNAKEIYFFREQNAEKKFFSKMRMEEQLEKQENRFSEWIRKLLLQTDTRDTYGNFLLRMIFYMATVFVGMNMFLLYIGIRNYGMIFLVSVVCGGVAFAAPVVKLWYRRKLLLQQAEYEIRQFQSVVLMERRMADATIPELLEDMEIFSRLFRRELRICINSYAAGPEKALRRLREEAGALHEGFRELAEGFLAVDEVGIRKAFAEVENNRRMMEKMSQMEAEIKIEQKKDGMDLLSKIPSALALSAYFILPFLLTSLQGVSEVFRILEEMRM